ncbi:hypothetical protein GCM10011322_09420 [Salinarimonas ramus]|uniref:Uncharacterized protein n=1 Tax=Salinarimonas ramus TaxID=690164 RepID=A0A917Q5N2_9HYPH|nr:hypothetical protein GCM10011322_09420 [Salinarimonas ramus]
MVGILCPLVSAARGGRSFLEPEPGDLGTPVPRPARALHAFTVAQRAASFGSPTGLARVPATVDAKRIRAVGSG